MRNTRLVQITATRSIGRILKGDCVSVDPFARPKAGSIVVTGRGRLSRWRKQKLIHGVAVRIERKL